VIENKITDTKDLFPNYCSIWIHTQFQHGYALELCYYFCLISIY